MTAVSRLGQIPEEFGKAPVRVESTGPLVLVGTQTVNTVALNTGDRVLVKDQVDLTENGIYVVQGTDPWIRANDLNRPEDVYAYGAITSQQTGTIYFINVPPGTYWNPGATNIEFVQLVSFPEAPIDGTPYARQDAGWVSSPPPAWGSITGTLSNQTDLQAAIDLKADASSIVFAIDGSNNIFGGPTAGDSITTGIENFMAGVNAGTAITGGNRNIFIGARAGQSLDTENDNIAIGIDALSNQISGFQNIAIGRNAMLGNATFGGTDNTAVGQGVMQFAGTTIGLFRNVGLGNFALQRIEGDENIGIGFQAMQDIVGDLNIAIGRSCLIDLGGGDKNIAIGYNAGFNISTGGGNILIGEGTGLAIPNPHSNHLQIETFITQRGTPLIGGDFSGREVDIHGRIFMQEQIGDNADRIGYGQIWVKDDTPNTLWFTDDTGVQYQLGTATPPAGLDTQIQYNNAGVFGADANFVWDGATLTVGGFVFIQNTAGVAYIQDSDTSGVNALARLGFRDSLDANMGNVGFSVGTSIMQVVNQLSNGELRLDCTGTTSKVAIRHNGTEMARSVVAASGGLEVNNTVTGAGFERVLTTSDLGGGGIGGSIANNQIAVGAVTANTIEGSNSFDWDGQIFGIQADFAEIFIEDAGNINNARIIANFDDLTATNDRALDFSLNGSTKLRIKNDGIFINEVLRIQQRAAADTNQTGYGQLYVLTADDSLHYVTEAGVDTDLTAAGIGGSITDNQIAVGATTADDIEGTANLTFDNATTTLAIGGTDPRLNFGSNGYISGGGGTGLLIQSDSGGGFVLQQRVNSGLMRFGCDDSGGTFRKNYEATSNQIELFANAQTRRMLIQANEVRVENADLMFAERADHAGTPAAGFGYLWVRNDIPNVLVFTDDAGTDTVLGSGGGGIGGSIADNQVAIGAATANDIEGSSGLTFDPTAFEMRIGAGTAAQPELILDGAVTTGQPTVFFRRNAVTQAYLIWSSTDELRVFSDNGIEFWPNNTSTGGILNTGKWITGASQTNRASLNIPEGVAPTTPVDGDVWVTAAGEFFARLNGVSVDLADSGPTIVTAVKTATTSRANDAAPSADPHLVVALEANSRYKLDIALRISCSSATPDFRWEMSEPSGTQWMVGGHRRDMDNGGLSGDVTPQSSGNLGVKSIQISATVDNMYVHLMGFVDTSSTAGDLTFEWSQNTSNAIATNLLIDSWMRVEKIV